MVPQWTSNCAWSSVRAAAPRSERDRTSSRSLPHPRQGSQRGQVNKGFRKVLERTDRFVWLEPPEPNDPITVLDVVGARDLAQHTRAVEQWARDVWGAWVKHHEYIKDLAESVW